ncbi:protein of unknown function [Candidatus Nitrosacidococcus tergens]|uniref:Uncharacterized protein n=1 Tax=Candidatus Nitrosacidococcus tergens TaxID=553981 RepID=A0A7G1Q9Q6_9GAMM|nr:protein of unknown function [Candidatus Nitrosacidococcus tergens]
MIAFVRVGRRELVARHSNITTTQIYAHNLDKLKTSVQR